MIKMNVDHFTGRMIFHCHLLDHEDQGMMSYFDIKGKEGTSWKGATGVDKQCYTDADKEAGYTLTSGSSLLTVQPSWVKGDGGDNCHVACADLGGCAIGSW